jgi:hypothetical protein
MRFHLRGVCVLIALGSVAELLPSCSSEPANACGPGPYSRLQVGAVSYSTKAPIAYGTGSFVDACPDKTFTSDANGRFDLLLTTGMVFEPRFVADGFITTRSSQARITQDLTLDATALFPTALQSLFPHLGDTTPDIVAITALPTGTTADAGDPCTTKDGVVFSVKDHPEAVVGYYNGVGIPTLDPSLQATSTVGAAEISGLPASVGVIEIDAAKPGCNISTVSYPHLGKYTLENGALTLAGAFMPPVAPP